MDAVGGHVDDEAGSSCCHMIQWGWDLNDPEAQRSALALHLVWCSDFVIGE